MPTRIVERLNPGLGADHDDRSVEYLVLDIIPDLSHLLEPAGHLPDVRPELFTLEIEEGLIVVSPGRNLLLINDTQRHFSQQSLVIGDRR